MLEFQRLVPRPHDPGEPGRSCPNHAGKSSAGIDCNPLARPGNPLCDGRDALPFTEAHCARFTVHQNGTFFYHSHSPMQQMMGMVGLFILHPPRAHSPAVDHDFGIVLQEWAVLPNNTVPNTANMEWNWLTSNGAV